MILAHDGHEHIQCVKLDLLCLKSIELGQEIKKQCFTV
jgi:hypothetical protein